MGRDNRRSLSWKRCAPTTYCSLSASSTSYYSVSCGMKGIIYQVLAPRPNKKHMSTRRSQESFTHLYYQAAFSYLDCRFTALTCFTLLDTTVLPLPCTHLHTINMSEISANVSLTLSFFVIFLAWRYVLTFRTLCSSRIQLLTLFQTIK